RLSTSRTPCPDSAPASSRSPRAAAPARSPVRPLPRPRIAPEAPAASSTARRFDAPRDRLTQPRGVVVPLLTGPHRLVKGRVERVADVALKQPLGERYD